MNVDYTLLTALIFFLINSYSKIDLMLFTTDDFKIVSPKEKTSL
jgi:hypothetical protein